MCTSIEQSEKLFSLGLDPSTSDMYYFLDPTPAGNIYHLAVQKNDGGVRNLPEYNNGDLPCWSLAALLELMPNFNMFKRTIECRLETTHHFTDKACDPTDAAFEMVCWLIEQEYIKVLK